MCCRLGYRQAESCKHRRSFQEFHSPENLWNATPLQNRLLAVIGGVCPSPKRMLRFAGLLGVLLMAKWNWGSLSKTRVGNVCGRLNDGAQGLHGSRGI